MTTIDEKIRINKYIALKLGLSRREADDLIQNKKVFVNDQLAPVGIRVSDSDKIVVNGDDIDKKLVDYSYLLLNKPVGYVCSRKNQGNDKTIYELLPQKFHSLKIVGRLDKDSSGLILLTNNGDYAFRMTHPKFQKQKTYIATLDKPLSQTDGKNINDGINLPDGLSNLTVSPLDETGRKWQVIMSEGRNRQIRRTFDRLGYSVLGLHRIIFGPYSIDNLKPGEFKVVDIK